MDYILDGLNTAQRAAVSSPASVLQVLAPPGSGKTKTLTARVAYLLSHYGYRPQDVICCTFTIKASREMRERIGKLMGDDVESRLILGTFHSICRRYLVKYGYLIGLRRGFGIADSSDSLAIIRRILKGSNFSIQPNAARSQISYQKAHGVSPDEFSARVKARNTKFAEQQELVHIYRAYESALATSNLLDYDDLLLRCADLLKRHPDCVSNVQAVLVDEFQDTNRIQYELMNLFASRNRRITIVGDPDQSIYGFRSAEIRNLTRMQRFYKDTSVVLLEDNYRSSGSILISAQDVIEQDSSRPPKKLQPTHCIGTMPVLRKLPTPVAEAKWMVQEIKRCIAMAGKLLKYSDVAVLLRSASLSRHIESEMGRMGVPYKMVGGSRFFDRVEVKLLLDYLRVVSHAENSDALLRVINVPSRRLGDESIKLLSSGAEEANVPLWDFVRDVAQGRRSTKKPLSSQANQGISTFVGLIQTGKQKLLEWKDNSAPRNLLQFFIDKLSFQEYIRKTYQPDEEGRWSNVEELLSQAEDTAEEKTEQDDSLPEIQGVKQQQSHPGEDALARFLANVALSTDTVSQEGEEQKEKVTISTIHAAKGLEWPVVFVPGVYEGSIPHSRADDPDEERRLLYVAMTRAQALLYLSFPLESQSGFETKQTYLTSFLPDDIIANRFRLVGPRLEENVVYQIADILRRPRPLVEDMLKGLDDLPSTRDDRWTADGVDMSNTVIRWDGSEAPNACQEPFPKRRRCEQVQSSTTTYFSSPNYTMTNASNFSVQSTSSVGFSTARNYIQTNPPPRAEPGQSIKNVTSTAGRKKGPSKSQNSNQSTSSNAQKPQTPGDAIGHPKHAASNPVTSKPSIPPKLAGHRPQARPRLSRPTFEPAETNNYSWLTDLLEGAENPASGSHTGRQNDEIPNAKRNKVQADLGSGELKSSSGQTGGVRQAATFHATTMSTLHNPATQVGRKTLGIRRNLGNGWEARMNRERNGYSR
ncbi:DNA- helicase [Aspergillus sclerotialis]|uniref:DNA 3'-5' helicase n=1 Tax=Aspergillus sclerotialis TaxID=2070753 RepID=A0A3A2ZVK7_9EURO|nr:DNA- helicase [Aspergillus sclerotialis]